MKIVVVRSPSVQEIEIVQCVEAMAPRDSVYFMPKDMTFEKFGRTLYDAEKIEMNGFGNMITS